MQRMCFAWRPRIPQALLPLRDLYGLNRAARQIRPIGWEAGAARDFYRLFGSATLGDGFTDSRPG